jgi:hypothetical protein
LNGFVPEPTDDTSSRPNKAIRSQRAAWGLFRLAQAKNSVVMPC